MNVADRILQLDLKIGGHHRGDCPACGGDNTFTVTRTIEGTLYNCYKAGFKFSGRKTSSIRVSDLSGHVRSSTHESQEPFALPRHVVMGHSQIREWLSIYDYPISERDIYYDLTESRIVFPIYHGGEIVDATGRSTSPERLPKWKRYGSSGYAYTYGEGTVAVVVEDAISAAVAGSTDANCTGMALLGTSLLPSHVEQLQGYTAVIVALDPDAAKKTLEITQELRGQLLSRGHTQNKVFAARLEDDLKYRRKNDMVLMRDKIAEFTEPN